MLKITLRMTNLHGIWKPPNGMQEIRYEFITQLRVVPSSLSLEINETFIGGRKGKMKI